ncbi:MAG: FHA domain-containing protein, partial [Anaerolineae bacterium]
MASSESDELSTTLDHLIVRHPDGTVSKTPIPNQAGATIAVGRELDNEVVLDDPRVSRRHAQIRRAAAGGLEITDVGSANGTFVGGLRVRLNQWSPLAAGQTVSIGGTRLVWEEAVSSQATVGMMPVAAPKGAAPAPPARRSAGLLPWLVGGGLLAAALVIVVLFINAVRSPAPPATTAATAAAGPVDIARQTPQGPAAGAPQPTATPASPAGSLPAPAIPSLTLEAVEFLPVISGALFDTSHVYLIASVRVENLGDEPFIVSTGRFAAQTQTGETITELGQGFAPS